MPETTARYLYHSKCKKIVHMYQLLRKIQNSKKKESFDESELLFLKSKTIVTIETILF